MLISARRIYAAVLTVCATIALSGALAATTTSSATAQSLSGCFLNGRKLFSFQADSGFSGTNVPDTIDCTNSPQARTMSGENSNDTIIGSRFNDIIRGGTGNDTIRGRAGNDFMSGDSVTDRCLGGNGTDTVNACETVTSVP